MSRPSSDVVRVVTVDDQPEVRSALRLMLGGEPDIAVVGEAVDGDHARDVIEACRPDVVLMDLRMPRCDGLVATARETALRPETAIIVLTTFDTDHHVVRALRAGACGFLLKDAPPDELAHAVRAAAQGRPVLAPAVLRRVMTLAAENTRPPDSAAVDALATLSPREREIARALARGMSNAEICAALFISLATVKTHVSRVIAKLGVESRTQVAALVLRNDPEHE